MRESVPVWERLWAKIALCIHGLECPYCCHEWTASRNKAGYGVIRATKNGKPGNAYATRVAWELVNQQPIPDGLFALHHCDNPPCVNLWHIYIGTRLQNVTDARIRGRLARGERRSPLREQDVLLIQNLYRQGQTMAVLARVFGITESTIGGILRGKTWTHLPAAIPAKEYATVRWSHHPKGSTHKNALLTEDAVAQIRLLARQGVSRRTLASQFGISLGHLCDVINYKAWQHVS